MAQEQTKRDQELDDVAYVMSDARGRRFMLRLLYGTGLFASVTVERKPNRVPQLTPEQLILWNAGQQDVGHFLRDEIAGVDSLGELFTRMMVEGHNRRLMEKQKGRTNGGRSGGDGTPEDGGEELDG